jgi:ABC-type phosphate transport system substrate-binding protein
MTLDQLNLGKEHRMMNRTRTLGSLAARQRPSLRILALTASAATALAVMAAAPALASPSPGSTPGTVTGSPASYETINGSGSTYEYTVLSQWINEVASKGLTVTYNPDGSAQGLLDYINGASDDFAASDLAFRTTDDKLAGTGPQHVPWGFSYVPGVAVGTAFMYHISVHGHLVRDLRLSGQTLMEIFTGQITNWDNPQITRDTGTQLPSLPIIPVIRSDDAGVTYFFTSWMAHEFPSQWNAFCDRVHPGIKPPCGPTEFYPSNWGNAKSEDGSTNVADFITSSQGQGAIGYDETPYWVNTGYPALALRNPAGKYVLPTTANVTTALTAALINEDSHSPDFLQENLNPVYAFKNPASYPLSSYSYLIVPRSGPKPLQPYFNLAAGKSLSAFLSYTLCQGQQGLGLGIPSLPANLVAGGLQQVKNIPGHGPVPAHCPS